MSITATELKKNLEFYLKLVEQEDIYIARNGKIIAKLTNPNQDRVDIAESLFGILPNDITKCRRKAPCFSNGDIRQSFVRQIKYI